MLRNTHMIWEMLEEDLNGILVSVELEKYVRLIALSSLQPPMETEH